METEKFDLGDNPETTEEFNFEETDGPDTGIVTGTIEDDIHEEDNDDLHEQFTFVKDMLGEDALNDKRNTYKMKDENNWPTTEYETEGGKKVVVYHQSRGSMWAVKFVPGGELPAALQGAWTNQPDAEAAVKLYLAK